MLSSVNTILHQRQLEEYYCTLCYAIFDLKRRNVTLANSGLPYPIRATADDVAQIELPGVPLGSFAGSAYDELTIALHAGDLFVFCSDGVFEAMNVNGEEFGAARLLEVVRQSRQLPARAIVDAIFAAVESFREDFAPNDDMTELVPAFVTIIVMVFTYNIGNGLTAGLVLYPLAKLLAGRKVGAGAIVLALICLSYYLFGLPH